MGVTINKVSLCKYLGVIIDIEFKWTDNINYVYNKLDMLTFFINYVVCYLFSASEILIMNNI